MMESRVTPGNIVPCAATHDVVLVLFRNRRHDAQHHECMWLSRFQSRRRREGSCSTRAPMCADMASKPGQDTLHVYSPYYNNMVARGSTESCLNGRRPDVLALHRKDVAGGHLLQEGVRLGVQVHNIRVALLLRRQLRLQHLRRRAGASNQVVGIIALQNLLQNLPEGYRLRGACLSMRCRPMQVGTGRATHAGSAVARKPLGSQRQAKVVQLQWLVSARNARYPAISASCLQQQSKPPSGSPRCYVRAGSAR